MLIEYIFYIALGYLSGSLMFGYAVPKLIKGIDVRKESSDGNPGTANAFLCGGALCGILVLLGDILKGLLPVWQENIWEQSLWALRLLWQRRYLAMLFP